MTEYTDEDLLMLSGIQHMAFCPRQWALIHIEQQWAENMLTVEGQHMHQRVDDPFDTGSGKHTVTLRSVSLLSRKLGLYGVADVVEFSSGANHSNGVTLPNKQGLWQPMPVEYKHGKPKPDERDEVQLCAQAMCLEEMYGVSIYTGFLFYGQTRHRHEVSLGNELRSLVISYTQQMHQLYQSGSTPPHVNKPHCKSCSLLNVCLPKTFTIPRSVADYLKEAFNND
jgi:CRISPR-associated exonuclease Cas4